MQFEQKTHPTLFFQIIFLSPVAMDTVVCEQVTSTDPRSFQMEMLNMSLKGQHSLHLLQGVLVHAHCTQRNLFHTNFLLPLQLVS